ncbi:MAG: DUF120 domain-containing protein [Candidatus Helarchaeota archaeon]
MPNFKCDHLIALIELAKLGAYDEKIKVSTRDLGSLLNISQQTASQRLIELEKLELIVRDPYGKYRIVQITNKGKKIIKKMYKTLKMVVETKTPKLPIDFPDKIKGIVYTGLGEGAYYISLDGYANQFIEKLNFKPYPGTLNLKLNSLIELRKRRILEQSDFPKIRINGFKDGKRTFGPVDALKVLINGKIIGALLFIQRTHHGAPILEIIAPTFLREKLGLKDGDEVELEILYEK